MENILSKYLKNNRKKQGLSLRELSDKCGVSHTEIWNIESGKKNNPNEDIIKKICTGLNLSFDNLILETGYNSTKKDLSHLKNNTSIRKFTEIYICNILQKYLSTKFTEFKFTKDHQINYTTGFDFIGFSEDNKIMVVEIKYLSNNTFNNRVLFNQIKSLFIDFYFNFKHKFNDDSMKFLAIIIIPNKDSYDYIDNTIKNSFNCLFPVFDYEIYTEEELSSLVE